MKAGKKKNRNAAEKITKFPLGPSGMEDLEDTELDALLEEELKREADELEARLNSDPKLIGVGASDDLFAKIVGSLKEQGVWEEDEKAVKAQKDEAGEEDAEKKEAKAAEEKMKKGKEKNIEENTEENTAASADENTQKIRKIESNEAEEKNATENVAFSDDKERETKSGSEEAYLQLSEADRRAMEYGYQMQQKDAEKKVRRKKRRKIAKRAGITAAALVAVFGVSMTSDANRRYVLEAWNAVMGNLEMKTELSYLESEVVYTQSTEEEKARQEIQQELGLEPVGFGYLPEGWKFVRYDIDEQALCAMTFYSNDEIWMTVCAYKNQKENVSYNQFDGEVEMIESIWTLQDTKIDIYQNGKAEEEGYTLMFEKNEDHYYCNVRLSYEEVKKIAEDIII